MNDFYKIPERTQWVIGVLMLLFLVVCVILWLLIDNLIIKSSLIFIMIPLYLFLSTPILMLTKKYNYVSPMLMYIKKKNKILELHSGTSFNYLFVLKNIKPGIRWRNRMLKFYLDGLSQIVEKIKDGEISETTKIVGTSYFLSNSLVNRLGFHIVEPEGIDKINFFLGYLDLIWMYSLAKGKIKFPKYSSFKRAEISGKQLLDAENLLHKYNNYFKNKNSA